MYFSKKIKKAILAVVASLAIITTSVSPVITADAATTVDGSATAVKFQKFLTMDKGASVPNGTFTFTIAPGVAVAGDATHPSVYAGIAGAQLTDGVTTADTLTVSFTSGDTTYDTVQVGHNLVNLVATNKYAVKEFTVDLSGVTFTEPGIYRYVITESGTVAGVSNDPENSRILDVYVETDANGDLTISSTNYIIHKTTTVTDKTGTKYNEPASSDDTTGVGGTNSFINKYATQKFVLESVVAGNQGYHGKYFKYTVETTGGPVGATYAVDLTDATSGALTYQGGSVTNPTTITEGTPAVFYLKHNQSIELSGLQSVTEISVTVTPEDYDASYVFDGGSSTAAVTYPSTAVGATNHTLTFTLTKQGTVPTGIVINTMPWSLLIALFAVLGIASNRIKKHTSI